MAHLSPMNWISTFMTLVIFILSLFSMIWWTTSPSPKSLMTSPKSTLILNLPWK